MNGLKMTKDIVSNVDVIMDNLKDKFDKIRRKLNRAVLGILSKFFDEEWCIPGIIELGINSEGIILCSLEKYDNVYPTLFLITKVDLVNYLNSLSNIMEYTQEEMQWIADKINDIPKVFELPDNLTFSM